MVYRRHRRSRGGRKLFKKKSSCKRAKPKGMSCRKVRGGWKRYRVKRHRR